MNPLLAWGRMLGLRTQLALGILVCIGVVGGILLATLPGRQAQIMWDTEQARLEQLASAAAMLAAPGLDFGDPEYVVETAKVFAALPEVAAIQVLDERGEIFYATPDPVDSLAGEEAFVRVSAPVAHDGRALGELVVVVRTDLLRESIAATRRTISLTVLGAMLVGVLAAIALGQYVSRPILGLSEAANQISKGDFGARVEVSRNDELGELADSFNNMATWLEQTTTSRDELESALDEVVRHRDLAEEALRVKSEFLANMSHEIRTPMNAIIGMTEVALSTDLDPHQRECLEVALESGTSLLVLLNGILDFSKIEAGKLELHPAPFSLPDLVSSVVAQQGVLTNKKKLALYTWLGEGLPRTLHGDVHRIQQVLTNLLGNAAKFTAEGYVALEVRRHHDEICFSVSDTGIGIPEAKRETIFRSFEQADGSTTRVYGGTGLGLAISSELARQMGGAFSVESTVGSGSCFSFTLPLRPVAEPEIGEPDWAPRVEKLRVCLELPDEKLVRSVRDCLAVWDIATVGPETQGISLWIRTKSLSSTAVRYPNLLLSQSPVADPTESPGAVEVRTPITPLSIGAAVAHLMSAHQAPAPRSIARPVALDPKLVSGERVLDVLVAEDNPNNQFVVRLYIERMGHSVRVVDNGAEAVEVWRNDPPDVILMDWHMPVQSGLDAARAIRAEETSGRIPIYALTANALVGDREECLRAGMDGYLSKPIHKELLRDVLTQVAQGKPARGDESAA